MPIKCLLQKKTTTKKLFFFPQHTENHPESQYLEVVLSNTALHRLLVRFLGCSPEHRLFPFSNNGSQRGAYFGTQWKRQLHAVPARKTVGHVYRRPIASLAYWQRRPPLVALQPYCSRSESPLSVKPSPKLQQSQMIRSGRIFSPFLVKTIIQPESNRYF